ncbi:MAG: peptide ABC transporter substrate-binding protein [Spirochaetales bacterium]|nr:peptide ABC transporter substrate-binding protein [Spirochaetales bacterium]
MYRRFVLSLLFFMTLSFLHSEEDCLSLYLGSGDLELDPHKAVNTTEAQLFTGIYEGLVTYHPSTMKPLPGLAAWWKLSDDKLTWTFYIREEARYSNGDKITAEHFRQSWLKSLSPERGSYFSSLLDVVKGASDYRNGLVGPEEVGIRVEDDNKFIVTLNEPAPHFLSIICHFSFVPIHPVMKNIEDWSRVRNIPVSGPYHFRSNQKGRMVLEINPYYWDRDSIDIETIEVTTGRDSQAVMRKFNRFEQDWIMSGYNTQLLSNPYGMVLSPLFGTTYYYFNNRDTPWDKSEVRRALALLLPWAQIYQQQPIPAHTLVPPIGDYPSPAVPMNQNIEEAMALLEKAGYPAGKGLPEIVIRIPSSLWGDYVPIWMKKVWEDTLETTVRIETIPVENYYDSLPEAGYTLGHLSWAGDYADPMTFLQMWQSESSFNDAAYYNEEYDALLELSTGASEEERFNELSEAEKYLLESGEVLPLAHFPAIHMLDLRFLGGWYANALDIHPFKYIYRKNDAPIPNTT